MIVIAIESSLETGELSSTQWPRLWQEIAAREIRKRPAGPPGNEAPPFRRRRGIITGEHVQPIGQTVSALGDLELNSWRNGVEIVRIQV